MDDKAEPFIEIHDIHSENNDRNMIRHNKKDVKVLQSSSVDSLRAQQSTTNAFYISLELCG